MKTNGQPMDENHKLFEISTSSCNTNDYHHNHYRRNKKKACNNNNSIELSRIDSSKFQKQESNDD